MLAFITHPSCLLHDMGPHHPECPERLAAIADRLLASGLDSRLERFAAPAATREQLERVHSAAYVDAIEAAAPSSGLAFLDPDTAMNTHSLAAARHAAGAVVHAVDLVMGGKFKSAFCAVRPPGHHAESRRAMGFCVFNNVAVGIAHAMSEHDVERLAVVDFDVHHGNGTEEMFANDARVLMVSTFQYPLYPYSGVKPLGTNMVNIPLSAGSGSAAFRDAVTKHWLPALEAHRPQLVMISAGFDAHRDDPLAGLMLGDEDYAWVTDQLVKVAQRHGEGRIVSTLEGGYALTALGRSAAEHVRQLLAA
ncbi:MAG TPA: histone deacetylase family protein [Casimicrobiaceae bacterium]|nr:histone deacetylase family protein [Casimicrobiaceae bacterium]